MRLSTLNPIMICGKMMRSRNKAWEELLPKEVVDIINKTKGKMKVVKKKAKVNVKLPGTKIKTLLMILRIKLPAFFYHLQTRKTTPADGVICL